MSGTGGCGDCGNVACACVIEGAGITAVSGFGTEGSPYIVETLCEDVQDCISTMFEDVGFVYDDASNSFDTGGAVDEVYVADGTGGGSWQPQGGGGSFAVEIFPNIGAVTETFFDWGLDQPAVGAPMSFTNPYGVQKRLTVDIGFRRDIGRGDDAINIAVMICTPDIVPEQQYLGGVIAANATWMQIDEQTGRAGTVNFYRTCEQVSQSFILAPNGSPGDTVTWQASYIEGTMSNIVLFSPFNVFAIGINGRLEDV